MRDRKSSPQCPKAGTPPNEYKSCRGSGNARWLRHQIARCLCQIGERPGGFGQTAILLRFLALASQHQNWRTTHICAGLEVAQRIANCRHAIEADVKACGDIFKHAALGLAAAAV